MLVFRFVKAAPARRRSWTVSESVSRPPLWRPTCHPVVVEATNRSVPIGCRPPWDRPPQPVSWAIARSTRFSDTG
jgi:hypothetical protein